MVLPDVISKKASRSRKLRSWRLSRAPQRSALDQQTTPVAAKEATAIANFANGNVSPIKVSNPSDHSQLAASGSNGFAAIGNNLFVNDQHQRSSYTRKDAHTNMSVDVRTALRNARANVHCTVERLSMPCV